MYDTIVILFLDHNNTTIDWHRLRQLGDGLLCGIIQIISSRQLDAAIVQNRLSQLNVCA